MVLWWIEAVSWDYSWFGNLPVEEHRPSWGFHNARIHYCMRGFGEGQESLEGIWIISRRRSFDLECSQLSTQPWFFDWQYYRERAGLWLQLPSPDIVGCKEPILEVITVIKEPWWLELTSIRHQVSLTILKSERWGFEMSLMHVVRCLPVLNIVR